MTFVFASFASRSFRYYWIAMFLSLIGSWVQMLALAWLTVQLTNSAVYLGLIGFLTTLPILLFSLPGGVVSDRFNKRRMLILTQGAMMLMAFWLFYLVQTGQITIYAIMLFSFFSGSVMALDGPLRQSFVSEIVEPHQLANAIPLNSVAFNLARIIGPAIAGFLIGWWGMASCFLINGLSFLFIIFVLLLIGFSHRYQPPPPMGGLWRGIAQVLRYIGGHPIILVYILMVISLSFFVMPSTQFMPLFAKNVWRVGARGLGYLMSTAGLGALLGALWTASRPSSRQAVLAYSSYLLAAVGLMLVALTQNFYLACFYIFLMSFGLVANLTLTNVALQRKVPNQLRGRLMSVYMLAFAGFTPFGNLLAGYLANILGITATFFIFGLAALLFSLVGLFRPRRARMRQG